MNQVFFLPTAAQLRRYLHQSGIRIKPWRSLPERLDSLYRQLADARRRDEFWGTLGKFAAEFATELSARRPASALVADMAQQPSALADEIRAALAKAREEPGGFRRLDRLLPQTPLTLLLALSLAVLGCGGAVADSEQAAQGGATGVFATGGTGSTTGGAPSTSTGGTTGPLIVAGAGGVMGCAESPSIQAIFDACLIEPNYTQVYLDALAACDPSWAEGMAAYFSCMSCDSIAAFLDELCEFCLVDEPFNLDLYELFCPQVIYLASVTAPLIGARRNRLASVFAPCTQARPPARAT